jgi:hypothetical protein
LQTPLLFLVLSHCGLLLKTNQVYEVFDASCERKSATGGSFVALLSEAFEKDLGLGQRMRKE